MLISIRLTCVHSSPMWLYEELANHKGKTGDGNLGLPDEVLQHLIAHPLDITNLNGVDLYERAVMSSNMAQEGKTAKRVVAVKTVGQLKRLLLHYVIGIDLGKIVVMQMCVCDVYSHSVLLLGVKALMTLVIGMFICLVDIDMHFAGKSDDTVLTPGEISSFLNDKCRFVYVSRSLSSAKLREASKPQQQQPVDPTQPGPRASTVGGHDAFTARFSTMPVRSHVCDV